MQPSRWTVPAFLSSSKSDILARCRDQGRGIPKERLTFVLLGMEFRDLLRRCDSLEGSEVHCLARARDRLKVQGILSHLDKHKGLILVETCCRQIGLPNIPSPKLARCTGTEIIDSFLRF